MNATSDRSGERLADVVSKVLSTVDCGKLEHAVARWRAGLARAAQQQSPQLTKRERKRLLKGKTKVKRGRERGLAPSEMGRAATSDSTTRDKQLGVCCW